MATHSFSVEYPARKLKKLWAKLICAHLSKVALSFDQFEVHNFRDSFFFLSSIGVQILLGSWN